MHERPGRLGWGLLLAGLPWSSFVCRLLVPFHHLDLWHAQSLWMQGGVLLMWGWHVSTHRPLAALPPAVWWLVVWLTGMVLWQFNILTKANQPYPAPLYLGVLNLWFVVFTLWLLASQPLPTLQGVLQAVFWSGCGLVGYGLVQQVSLDPFFYELGATPAGKDVVQGTIGNPTHFACQLALWLPLALIQPRFRKLWALPALWLIGTLGSATALLVTGLVLMVWVGRYAWKASLVGGAVALCLAVGWSLSHPAWLNPFGRLEVWRAWGGFLKKHALFGHGLGSVKYIAPQLPLPLFGWKHLHNEYLQLWVEGGLVALVLLGWWGWQLWQRRHHGQPSDLRWACAAMLGGFLVIATLSFPWHLWGLGMFGLVALAGWLTTTQEQVA